MQPNVFSPSRSAPRVPFATLPAELDDGAISWDKLPNQERQIVRHMVWQAKRRMRTQLLMGMLITLGCMLVVLIGAAFAIW